MKKDISIPYNNENIVMVLNKIKDGITKLMEREKGTKVSYDMCSISIFVLTPEEYSVWLKFYGFWLDLNPHHPFKSPSGKLSRTITGYLYAASDHKSRLAWLETELDKLK